MSQLNKPEGGYDGDELLFYIPSSPNWRERKIRRSIFLMYAMFMVLVLTGTFVLVINFPKPDMTTTSTTPTTTVIPTTMNLAATMPKGATGITTPAMKPDAMTVAMRKAARKTKSTFGLLKPLPVNATDYPAAKLLTHMGMRPKFTEIKCQLQAIPTFKYCVIVYNNTYIGEGQNGKDAAITSSARVANEALFGIRYHEPMPNATYPCEEMQ